MKKWSFGFQRHSSYLEIFNDQLLKMKETGSLARINDKYKTKRQQCPDLSGSPLGFESVIGTFLVLGTGIVASLIILVVEFIVGSYTENWKENLEIEDNKVKNNSNPDIQPFTCCGIAFAKVEYLVKHVTKMHALHLTNQ